MYRRVLLTGGAGKLGHALRPHLAATWPLRSSDIADLGPAHPNEELVRADLADRAAIDKLVEGCEAIVHLGGISTEAPFDPILQANILGLYNVFEAARKHGAKRIVFA